MIPVIQCWQQVPEVLHPSNCDSSNRLQLKTVCGIAKRLSRHSFRELNVVCRLRDGADDTSDAVPLQCQRVPEVHRIQLRF
jgi:hypothetical protein